MGIEELSNPLGRPEDPKYWELSNVVLKMDATVEDAEGYEEEERQLIEYYDKTLGIKINTVAYVAMQRVSRRFGVRTIADFQRHEEEINREMAAWLDGFTTGATWKVLYP